MIEPIHFIVLMKYVQFTTMTVTACAVQQEMQKG